MKPENFVLIGRYLMDKPDATQRELAVATKLSLGLVNSTIKAGIASGALEQKNSRELTLTESGAKKLDAYKVKNAIILAAGFGLRCVPLTYETPKGLLEVYGVPMIERQIEQLHEKGITEIIIVVGYKKESFDYLIDKYGVKLVFNPEYATKNNLSSLYCARQWLDSTYVMYGDNWIESNIFNAYEPKSWYSTPFAGGKTVEWCVTTSASDRIEKVITGGEDAWVMVGPSYFSSSFSALYKKHMEECVNRAGTEDYYYEQVFLENLSTMQIYANRQAGNVYEFDNLEELRMFDPSYNEASNSEVMQVIAKILKCTEAEVQIIRHIKEGLSNNSFVFSYDGTKYVMRVPGAGVDMANDRAKEVEVYGKVAPLGICDDLIYIDANPGYKITKYLEKARVCDPYNPSDVKICMKKLREFHELKLECNHTYDLFDRIEYYESLWHTPKSLFRDYEQTKANIMKLRKYIESVPKDWCITMIDSNHNNMLMEETEDGVRVRLIDWEYASMQDPHVDIAAFVNFANYNREQVEALIDAYFVEGCPSETRRKIYAYIAVYGLGMSTWAEYKSQVGVEFGEFILQNYRLVKDYYRIFNESI